MIRLFSILIINFLSSNLLLAQLDLSPCAIDTILIKDQTANLFEGFYHTDFTKQSNCDQLNRLSKNISLGKSKAPFDFYFVVRNNDPKAFEGYLFFQNVNLDSLFLEVQSNNDTIIYTYSEKDPLDKRLVKNLNCVFPVNLQSQEVKHYFLRIRHAELSLHTEVSLCSTASFIDKITLQNFILGAFFGIQILLILLIPLLFYFKKNSRLTFFYIFYHLVVFLALLDLNGILLGYIVPMLAPYEKQVSIILVSAYAVLLVELILELFHYPNLKILNIIRYSLFGFLILGVLLLPIGLYIFPLINCLFVLIIMCLVNSFWLLYKNFNVDRNVSYLFVIGLGSVIICGIYRIIVKSFGLPAGFIFHHGLMIVYFIEVLCFFGILAHTTYKTDLELEKKALNEKLFKLNAEKELLEERNRIGQELHDDLGSGLTRMKYLAYQANLSKNESKDTLLKISKTSDNLISNMREIIWAMDSNSDDIHDFVSYSRRYIEEYLEQFDIKLNFQSKITADFLLPGQVRRKTLLIIKEAIHNIVKHSSAGEVEVKIIQSADSMLNVSIVDNGVGFNPKLKSQGEKYGLKNMKDLTTKLDGHFKIEVNEKTSILFSIPI